MTIEFKRDHLRWEFDQQIHPAVRAIVRELDAHLGAKGWPGVTITHAWRSLASMADIYGRDWRARGLWSWHLVGRAVDIRNRDWSPEQREEITAWLEDHWPDAEVLMHDIGRGNHLHLGVPAPGSRLRRLRRWITKHNRKEK